jgi:hypothetical protein
MPQPKPNFQRMMQIIDSVFSTRNDPNQLQVNTKIIKKLQSLHQATLTELTDENGPLIWILMIPTTKNIMQDFVDRRISEKVLFDRTEPGQTFDCIYLCSATTLPEYRGKGATKALCLKGIAEIKTTFPIKALFVWPFTKEGNALALSLAKASALPLFVRKDG